MFQPEGIYAAMLTPFDQNGRVNLGTVAKMVDILVEKGVDGIFPVSNIDTIVAIKESSGSVANLQNILNLVDGMQRELRVMVAWEEMLLTALTAGAHGCMATSGGILPELMTAIAGHFRRNEFAQAARIQRLVARVTEQMRTVFFPYGYELGMQARGFDMGPFAIDIPATYARQLQDQQKNIAVTIDEVVRDAQVEARKP